MFIGFGYVVTSGPGLEPLSALFMINVGLFISLLRAFLSFLVRLSCFMFVFIHHVQSNSMQKCVKCAII